MSSQRIFVATVTFGANTADRGHVYSDGKNLWAEWPDGGCDTVFRARRGWLWDEYGDDEAPVRGRLGRETTRKGTRLPVVSRRQPAQVGA
jgi:hypothetical protein